MISTGGKPTATVGIGRRFADARTDGLLMPLSARSAAALTALARGHLELLRREPPPSAEDLRELCYTAAARSSHHEHRLAVTGSPAQIEAGLTAFVNGDTAPGLHSASRPEMGAPKLAFVFPGQGTHWLGMGCDLFDQEPVFRETLEACDDAIARCAGWSLLDELHADAGTSRLARVDVVAPCFFAIQVGLAALWCARGIKPDAIVGNSLGEVTAAHAAGILDLADAVRIVCRASSLVHQHSPRGAMAVVELSSAEAQEALRGFEGRVSVSAANSRTSSIISGECEAVEQLRARLEERQVFAHPVNVGHAFHGPQMNGVAADFAAHLEALSPRAGACTIYSSLTGTIEDGSRLGTEYWARNLRSPVRFRDAVQRLIADGHEIFLEISPHPLLLGPLRENLAEAGREGVVLSSLRRGAPAAAALTDSLGALYVNGRTPDWQHLYPDGGRSTPGATRSGNAVHERDLIHQVRDLTPPQRATPAKQLDPEPEPIAIIGIGCRFPGGANGPDGYWRVLRDGIDAIGEVPPDRWDADEYYDPQPGAPDKIVSRSGGFLERADEFDAEFFGISPREAKQMDPQQRLALEVTWEALEDAGLTLGQLRDSSTGVFFGVSSFDYMMLEVGHRLPAEPYFATGAAHSILTGRISYLFDLLGPSVPVDTACSSSLVAVHLACQSLQQGSCRMALAGGVNVILVPEISVAFSMGGFLAADGRCKTFDARADGYGRGEGSGVVVLKRLSDARADRDRILALMRGSALNQDGRSAGITAPKASSQSAVIRSALLQARVDPGEVGYVEAHGTGTPLGDPIEIEALTDAIGQPRAGGLRCAIGTAKTNFGHLEAAAGMAGLIKAALALKHGAIPPNLHFEKLNPHIKLDGTPFFVPTELTQWPGGSGRRIAGVSSFGFSGTNAHVILEEAPADPPGEARDDGAMHLLPVSARSGDALRELAGAYRDSLREGSSPAAAALSDTCFSAGQRRSHHRHRLAVAGRSSEEIVEGLSEFVRVGESPRVHTGVAALGQRPGTVFVFSGQGAQWATMGNALLQREPHFRAVLEHCDELLRGHASWSLLTELAADDSRSRLHETQIAQPAIFSLQVALASLWRSRGIEADAVVGHSVGEVAAAHVSGALDLEEAVHLVYHRARLMQRATGRGRMAAVALAPAAVEPRLADCEGSVSIAAINGPAETVLSGSTAAIEVLVRRLEEDGVPCRWLRVDYAFHSPQMDPFAPELAEILSGLSPRKLRVPLVSTVTGAPVHGSDLDASYWARNLREPVRFAAAIAHLLDSGYDAFVEINAHPVLAPALGEIFRDRGDEAARVVPSLRRGCDEEKAIAEGLAGLYVLGCEPDWQQCEPESARYVPLPTYPWQHQRFWFDRAEGASATASAARRVQRPDGSEEPAHPFLVDCFESAAEARARHWETLIGTRRFPYLADHRVGDAVVFPAAAFLEMALAACEETFGHGPHAVDDFHFERALVLPEGSPCVVQTVLRPASDGRASLEIFSRAGPGDGWTRHGAASVRVDSGETEPTADAESALPKLRARIANAVPVEDFYRGMAASGLDYGPAFRGIRSLWNAKGEALARVALPESAAGSAHRYRVHPALLDAAFQVGGATLEEAAAASLGNDTYLPVGLRALAARGRPQGEVWVHAALAGRSEAAAGAEATGYELDVRVFDTNGALAVEARGLRVQRLGTGARRDSNEWYYRSRWEKSKAAAPPAETAAAPVSCWLLLSDRGDVGGPLGAALEAAGERVVRVTAGDAFLRRGDDSYELDPGVPQQFREMLDSAFGGGDADCRGVVHLWSLDAEAATSPESLRSAQRLGCLSTLHLVQALVGRNGRDAPRLWLVTRGAQAAGSRPENVAIAQAPLWGLGKVISMEHPEFCCTRLDLDPGCPEDEQERLLREFRGPDAETEIALRGGDRLVARLARCAGEIQAGEPPATEPVPPGDEHYRLEITRPGMLEDLRLRQVPQSQPGVGEIQIRVQAAGLNFKDVLLAMGVVPSPSGPGGVVPLGGEGAGTVTAVGPDVEEFEPGDEVVAVAPFSFGRSVTTRPEFVAAKPASLSFEQAASLPLVFMTAVYALEHVGRIAGGERVLVHAGAGGVGLAAVQVAQVAGAEVLATAGSPEKREYLARQWGVEHAMDSRSLDFAAEVMEQTGGRGVDLVLNSLSGEAIDKNFEVLAPYGRFLEIGIRDIYENRRIGLLPFSRNLSYAAIDLARIAAERPELFGALLRDVMQRFEKGVLHPVPVKTFPISRAEQAFRHMAQARHIGKIALQLDDPDTRIEPTCEPAPILRSDATYLITGGLGGLGLSLAAWMVEQGARSLVLVGRSDPSPEAQAPLGALRSGPAEVRVARADVAAADALAGVLAEIERELPPLRGVFHAAGVLDDGVLLGLDAERFEAVMAPKLLGAWNLHELTRGNPLDHFVLFSSAASLLGSPGQANYSAANAFLDALAHHRAQQGLPALSIDWGPWDEVGMTATADRSGRLGALGIASIAPAAGWRVLAELLEAGLPQVGVLDLNLGQWLELFPAAAEAPFLAELVRETDADASTQVHDVKLLRELTALDSPRERLDFMERYLRGEIAQALRMDPSDIDPRQSLADMGFDSLLALEFKNRTERALGITLSATALLTHPTLESLAPLIAQRLGIDAQDAEPEHPAPEPAERVGAHGAPAGAAGEDVRERADERREAMRQRAQLRRGRGHGVESESR